MLGERKGQLKELLTGYGPLGILWFDGEWESPRTHERGVDLYNYVRSLQPSIIVNNRTQPLAVTAKAGEGVSIAVPAEAPDANATVIVLEIEGAPQVRDGATAPK